VDADPRTGNIDLNQLSEAARDLSAGGKAAQKWLPRLGASSPVPSSHLPLHLKAILPVDVFGQPPDMDSINQIARLYGLAVIEDSCEALGSEYKGRKAGRLGDYGVYAFYPNKQITTGEGGVIVTDNDQAAGFMRALRNQGRAPGRYLAPAHLPRIQLPARRDVGRLGRHQMQRIEELLAKREQVSQWYGRRLAGISGVEQYQIDSSTTRMSWFVYVIKFARSIDRTAMAHALEARGIPVRPYFAPSISNPSWSSALATAWATSPSPKTWVCAGWPSLLQRDDRGHGRAGLPGHPDGHPGPSQAMNPADFPPPRRRGRNLHILLILLLAAIVVTLALLAYRQALGLLLSAWSWRPSWSSSPSHPGLSPLLPGARQL